MNLTRFAVPAALAGITVLLMAGPAHAGVFTVPEPGTLILLGTGAAAVGALAWWRKRRKLGDEEESHK
jgi:PEP-CTERM motif-containing protein